MEILMVINRKRNVFITTIYKNTDLSYSYVVINISILEKNGLIKITKQGRKKMINLTKQGRLLANKFEEIAEILKNGK